MITALAFLLLLPATAGASSTTTAVNDVPQDMKTLYRAMEREVDPRLREGDYLGALDAAAGYLRRQKDADLIAFLLDVEAPILAAAGGYEGALVYMSRAVNLHGRALPPRRYDEDAWADARREVKWREPADVLREAAKTSSVVMISEAHHVPETRALGRELLPLLRELGFEYFAMETLKHPVPALVDRVAISTSPSAAAGYYFMEPQAAGLARDALKLGFKLVAYEDETTGEGDREEIQARNLYDRVLKKKPAAKVVVWAGYGHVHKRKSGSRRAMAAWVWALTGREPFSLYQVADALDPRLANSPFYKPLVLDAADRPARPLVLMNAPGLYPALDRIKENGLGRDADGLPVVDGYIVHPPFAARAPGRLRPAWLVGAGRSALTGSVAAAFTGPLLVQAFPEAEGPRSSPADQMVVEPDGRFELWLPEGNYLIRLRDAGGKVLAEAKAAAGSTIKL